MGQRVSPWPYLVVTGVLIAVVLVSLAVTWPPPPGRGELHRQIEQLERRITELEAAIR